MLRILLLTLGSVLSLVLPTTSAEPVLSQYRGITLGNSVEVVVDRMQMGAADVKLVRERPALVQELTWRPHRFVSGASVEPDPLAELVLTFYMGRLARIAVTYDRERTQGLTDEDLTEAMTRVYGESLLISAPTHRTIRPSIEREPIRRWEDTETLLLLWRERDVNRVGLTLTLIADDLALQAAIAAGAELDAADGPVRDLARRTAEAVALQAQDEKTRRDNKAAFKP